MPFVTYYGYCHSLDGSTLFSKGDSNKLRINVKNKMTLIDAKFDAALVNISEVTSRKTKWPRFFLAYPVRVVESLVHPRAFAVANLKNMSYPERLKILGLTTLESRRLRGDLI